MVRTKEEIDNERRQLKKEYRQLYDQVSALLFRLDPIGINFETNTDEYEPETGSILPKLKDCSGVQDVQTMIHEEFVRWFDRPTAGPESLYTEIAKEIWDLWVRHSETS